MAGAVREAIDILGTHRIQANLDTFAAQRLIDAGLYPEAVKRLACAFRHHPAIVTHNWYNVIQAMSSAMGMASLFL